MAGGRLGDGAGARGGRLERRAFAPGPRADWRLVLRQRHRGRTLPGDRSCCAVWAAPTSITGCGKPISRDQADAPSFPWLGLTIAAVERLDAVLLVGAYPRKEHPIINHRLRKATLAGADVMVLGPGDGWAQLPRGRAAGCRSPGYSGCPWRGRRGVRGAETAARQLSPAWLPARPESGALPSVCVTPSGRPFWSGPWQIPIPGRAACVPSRHTWRRLPARATGILSDGANGAGAWLAGVLPHRGPGGKPAPAEGLSGPRCWPPIFPPMSPSASSRSSIVPTAQKRCRRCVARSAS